MSKRLDRGRQKVGILEGYKRPSFREQYTGEKEDQAFEELDEKLNGEKSMDKNNESPVLKDNNPIERPSHYMFFDTEAINIIKASLTEEEYKGYLKGNSLKYRLRCGKKDDAMQDLGKAEQYEKMWGEAQ